MGGFKRASVALSIFVGAFWAGLTGNSNKASEEIFHGFRQLGGVYVKFLQILSLKKIGVLGNWDNKEALAVFDAVRPDELDIHDYLRREIPPDLLGDIVHLDSAPFAAGSFGQVYYGQHRDGTAIIVKALRPGLVDNIKIDLRIIKIMAYVLNFTLRAMATDLRAVFRDFRKVILAEIDYKTEAAHAKYFYEYFKGHEHIVIPKTYLELCSANLIVQEYLPGIPLTEVIAAKDDGHDPIEYVKARLGSDLTKQIAELGEELTLSILSADWILGDPHPGNIKLLSDNKLGIYDFGITGLPPDDRQAFRLVLEDYIKISTGDFDPGDVFVNSLRFFAQDLFRAMNTVARAVQNSGSFDFIEELKGLVRKTYTGNKQRFDKDKLVRTGQISRVISRTVNEGNRFAVRIEFDSSVMIRAADGYLNIVDKLDLRSQLIPEIFNRGLERFDNMHDIMLTSTKDTMDLERAVDIISNWVQDMYERDPILFRQFVKGFRRSTAHVNE